MSSKIEYDVGYIFVEITSEGIYLLYHLVAIRLLCIFNFEAKRLQLVFEGPGIIRSVFQLLEIETRIV